MSVTSDPSAVLQQLAKAGQAAAQWFAQQGAVATTDGGNEVSPLMALQKEWAASHVALWQAFLARRPEQGPVSVVVPDAGDKRFSDAAWSESPIYDYLRQAYLINAGYLKRVGEQLPVDDEHARSRLKFALKQYIDAMSPANFAATSPEFIKAAIDSKGESIQRGILNLLADMNKGRISMTDDAAFAVGVNLALTSGAVVFENDLFQLIQYAPLTDKVAQRPLLIVPPCINKYYVLDLQPQNSFVRYAVEQGNTVFLVSWRNVKSDLGHLAWDDYVEDGVLKALAVVRDICGTAQTNALGFCVGGTLLSSALAVAVARGEQPVKSLTLLATLLDFAAPGDLGCFVDEASIAAREQSIGKGGIFPGRDFASVFSVLRPNDLIWQYVVRNYLIGKTPPAFDLLFWNSDSTNLPGPFLAWYLRNMYLENNLREPGKLRMCGASVDLGRVKTPAFVLATREDHIVPWYGAYRSLSLLGGETTFVLGASGHIAGVINPATANRRSHWVGTAFAESPDDWLNAAVENKGSWWPVWTAWLKPFGGRRVAARSRLGNEKYQTIEPAPGRYVREKA